MWLRDKQVVDILADLAVVQYHGWREASVARWQTLQFGNQRCAHRGSTKEDNVQLCKRDLRIVAMKRLQRADHRQNIGQVSCSSQSD